LQHPQPEGGFGGEPHRRIDAGLSASLGVGAPLLGQVQFPVQQHPPVRVGIGAEDTDLAVLGTPGGAGVLPLDPGRLDALLQEAGVVDDQHTCRVAEVVDDVFA
jgi:hypothetical protein